MRVATTQIGVFQVRLSGGDDLLHCRSRTALRYFHPMISRQIRISSIVTATLILSAGLSGCASFSEPKNSGERKIMEPAGSRSGAQETPILSVPKGEDQRYRQIFKLYSGAQYEEALESIDRFFNEFPKSKLHSQVENLRGLSFLLTHRPAQAAASFQKAVQLNTSHPQLNPYIQYNLAIAQYELRKPEDSMQTLLQLSFPQLDRDTRIKAHYLKAKIYDQFGQKPESMQEVLQASLFILPSTHSETRSSLNRFAEEHLTQVKDPVLLDTWIKAFPESPLQDALLFRKGEVLLQTQQIPQAEETLKLLTQKFPESPYYSRAVQLVRSSPQAAQISLSGKDRGPVAERTIGVLLPMTGKFAKFGARALQGIQLGARIYDAESKSKNPITLIVEDSGEDAESAQRALVKLTRESHVAAVIGPLLSKGIEQVTAKANDLGVPLVSLARSPGLPGEYVFQSGMTLKLQAYEVARYAIQKLGLKRFAIVYPQDKVGEEGMNAFWDAVQTLGGEIKAVESYPPNESDFRAILDRLSGRYYTEARTLELEALARAREENQIKKRTRKTEQYFSLEPRIDFDAVFIPEESKVSGLLIPSFAYRDIDKITFLGTSAWNSPDFPSRVAQINDPVYFVDAFVAEHSSPYVRSYVEQYRATFEQEPTAMDAMAYDVAKILDEIFSRRSGAGREEIRESLERIRNFQGVTGQITASQGSLMRDLKVLTVDQAQIVPVEAVPRSRR